MAQELFGDSWKSQLDRLAAAARAVHKSLLESTRRDYERAHGRVESPYALFSLAANDPAFAWLRPLTRLIVELEDRLDPKAPAVGKEAFERARAGVSALLAPGSGDFAAAYHDRVQRDSDVAVEHGRLRAVLANPEPPRPT